MWEIRKKKIESMLHDKIGYIILKGDIKDPRINKIVTVTNVSVTRDVKEAKVSISVMGDEKAKEKAIYVLNHAAGYIQKLLGSRIHIKSTPRLHFILDDSIETGLRISQKLEEIKGNKETKGTKEIMA